MRLIDADELLHKAVKYDDFSVDCNYIVWDYDIEDAPTVDPVKRGHWIWYGPKWPECSECHTQNESARYFCPNCGADMRGNLND